MEILEEVVHWGVYCFNLVVLLVGLSTVLTLTYLSIVERMLSASFLGTLVAILMALVLVIAVNNGPRTTYKSVITDFNEVYEQGYKVEYKDGEFYILSKMEDD